MCVCVFLCVCVRVCICVRVRVYVYMCMFMVVLYSSSVAIPPDISSFLCVCNARAYDYVQMCGDRHTETNICTCIMHFCVSYVL
jgi:hypothetical protein